MTFKSISSSRHIELELLGLGGAVLCFWTPTIGFHLAYIRWLGDRYGIEKITTTWNETVVDRIADLEEWTHYIQTLLDRPCPIFGYVNNHYSGYAPAAVELLEGLLERR